MFHLATTTQNEATRLTSVAEGARSSDIEKPTPRGSAETPERIQLNLVTRKTDEIFLEIPNQNLHCRNQQFGTFFQPECDLQIFLDTRIFAYTNRHVHSSNSGPTRGRSTTGTAKGRNRCSLTYEQSYFHETETTEGNLYKRIQPSNSGHSPSSE